MYDVIVVGGGPIGCITASLLAKNNVNVLLIEKQKHPRWKPCGEGVSSDLIQILKQNRLFTKIQHQFYDIYETSLNILNKNLVTFRRDIPVAYTLDRKKFDYELISYAKDIGVEVHENEKVKNISVSKNPLIRTNSNSYKSRILVGSDGVYSVVGKKLYRKWTEDELVFAEVAKYKFRDRPELINKDVMEFYIIENGYGWIFPKVDDGQLILNIGILTIDRYNIRQLFYKFIRTIEDIKNIKLKNLEIDNKIYRHLIPGKGPCRGTYKDPTLLIGDAGGFVNPLTGGGLKYGILSAIHAKTTIIKLFNHEIESLKTFEDFWIKDIKHLLERSYLVRRELYSMSLSKITEKIEEDSDFKKYISRSFLGVNDH